MVNVGDLVELQAALAAAAFGTVIEVAGGSYGSLAITGRAFPETVEIRAADPDDPPVFRDILIRNSRNIALSGIRVRRPLAAGEPDWTPAIRIESSAHVRLSGSDIAGSIDGDPSNDGHGLKALDSSHIVLERNHFHNLKAGVQIGRSRHVTVHANVLRELRSDGINLGNVQDATVAWNRLTDFHPAHHLGDHPDMIQVWNNGAVQDMARITIRDNTLQSGNGDPVQAIFVQGAPPGEAGRFAFAARDIIIESNLIETDAAQGIWVSDFSGVTIRANAVAHAHGGGLVPTIRIVRTPDAVVSGNVAPRIDAVASPGAQVASNTIIPRKGGPGTRR